MPLEQRERELFEAFVAGFEASGEGYNGEYTNSAYRKDDRQEQMHRLEFEAWRTGRSTDDQQHALWFKWREEDES